MGRGLPVVHVLLSSFNGEKYIREQIDSILNQKDVQVVLSVRDDGSTDGTREILREYQDRYENVFVELGCNIGYKDSFMHLLQDCSGQEGDYFAFSDQDDIWDQDKLAVAVDKLKELKTDGPALYYSDLKVTDEAGHFIRLANSWEGTIDKYLIAMFVGVRGCTEVFNDKLQKMLKNIALTDVSYHDTFVALAAFWLGKVVYDPDPHIRYRQTGQNTSMTGTNPINHFLKNLKYVHSRMKKQQNVHEKHAKVIIRYYGEEYSTALEDLKKVASYRESFRSKIRLIQDKRFFRFPLSIRVFNSFFVLTGKL